MRHLHSGRKLGVNSDQRRALLRGLTLAILERESIKTTTARAKELRWYADRMVTLAKRGDVAGRRRIIQLLGSTQTYRPGENRVRNAIENLYTNLVPRFKDRPGGYTQIFRLGKKRAGDNADVCLMRYIPGPEEAKKAEKSDKKEKATKKAAPKAEDKAQKHAAEAPSDKPAKKAKEAKK